MIEPTAILNRARSAVTGGGAALCTLAATSLAVAATLSIVSVMLSSDARTRIQAAETERLEAAERIFTTLEARRQGAQLGIISTLAENPRLTAVLDAYDAESQVEGGLDPERETLLRNAAASEARTMAQATGADAVAILDARGGTIASAGRAGVRWGPDHTLAFSPTEPIVDGIVALPTGAFRISGTALRLTATTGTRTVGTLVLATSLDTGYARDLTSLARTGVVIAAGKSVVGSTVPKEIETALLTEEGDPAGLRVLDGRDYVVRTLLASDHVRIHMLTPIDDAVEETPDSGRRVLFIVTIGCLLIGAGALVGLVWTSSVAQGAPRGPLAATADSERAPEQAPETETDPVPTDSPSN